MGKTLGMWISGAAQALEAIAEDREQAWIEARRLAAFGLKKPESWLVAHADQVLMANRLKALDALLKRRLKREPMEYLLGSAVFFGREFAVDKRVLIPRPETEDLVVEALKDIRPGDLVVEIGTGSGAIAVSVATERPDVTVFASDTDAAALSVARKNARRLAPGRIRFFHGSLFHPALIRAMRTVGARRALPLRIHILANLPYLPASDRKTMPASVIRYEPAKALFAKDDGMELNKRLLEQVASLIHPDRGAKRRAEGSLRRDPSAPLGMTCAVLLEFDPPQSKKLSAFAKSLIPDADVSIIRDRCGRERLLRVSLQTRRKSRHAS
ncbi:HemK family protein methyltransferase [Candidatus Uhrbacteria bacterium]|nr:MAG: HemK family protein methyltransferase [Candidatus Uhrbacteria bacterium]